MVSDMYFIRERKRGREGERERKGERERERSGEDSSQPRQLVSKWEWRSSRDSACGGGGAEERALMRRLGEKSE